MAAALPRKKEHIQQDGHGKAHSVIRNTGADRKAIPRTRIHASNGTQLGYGLEAKATATHSFPIWRGATWQHMYNSQS